MVTSSFENNSFLIQWLIQNESSSVVDLTTIEDPLKSFLISFNSYDIALIGAFYKSFNFLSIAHGFITVLGKGSNPYLSNIIKFNLRARGRSIAEQQDFIIIAYDAIGGFFCLNSQTTSHTRKGITYFDPSTLQMTYFCDSFHDFLYKIAYNNTENLYLNIHWNNWQTELKKLPLGQVFDCPSLLGNGLKIILEDSFKFPTPAYLLFAQHWNIKGELDTIINRHITPIDLKNTPLKVQKNISKLENYITSQTVNDLYKVNEPYLIWINNSYYEDEIVREIESSLQTGFLSAHIKDRPFNELELIIHYGDYTFSHLMKNKNSSLAHINKILLPDFEIRFCKSSTATETKGLIVLDKISWEVLKNKYTEQLIDELFIPINDSSIIFPIKKQ